MMSITLWNYSIAQESQNHDSEGLKKFEEKLKLLMTDAELRRLMRCMLNRKRQMYPDIKRIIVNYELTETSDGFHLSVASTIP